MVHPRRPYSHRPLHDDVIAGKVPMKDMQRSHTFRDMTNMLVGERRFLLVANTTRLKALKMVPNTQTKVSRLAMTV